jgi:putative redox protein
MGQVLGQVFVRWIDSQLMLGVDSYGHSLVAGSWPERDPEWEGLKPSDLFLLSIAACSAYDVVMILKKQREPLEGLEVMCSGEQLPDPPYTFTSVHLVYRVRGGVRREKLARAIELSEGKYCSVVNTVKPVVKVSSEYEILSNDQPPRLGFHPRSQETT